MSRQTYHVLDIAYHCQTYNVLDTTYHCHAEPDGSSVMEVRYVTSIQNGDRLRTFSEYHNFENEATRGYSTKWWKECSPDSVPETNQHAVDIANYHGIKETRAITVEYGIAGYRIIGKQRGERGLSLEETW